MFHKYVTVAAAACFAVLAGTHDSAAQSKIQRPFNDGYQFLTFSLQGEGAIAITAGLEEINGRIAFCGMYWPLDSDSSLPPNYAAQILAKVYANLDGIVLGTSGAGFQFYPSIEAADKSPMANCSMTQRSAAKVKNIKSFKLKLSRRSVME